MIGAVVETFATAIDVVFLIWFIPKFIGTSIKKHPKSLIWAVLLLVFQLFADRILQGMDLLYALIDFILALCFALSFEKRVRLWNLFSGFIYVIVIMLANTLVFSIFSLFATDFALLVQGEMSNIRLIYLIVCKMVNLSFYRFILLIFRKEHSLDIKNSTLSFLFTVITAIGLGIVLELTSVFELGKFGFLMVALAVILIFLNVILYLMINQVQNLLKSKYELSMIQEKIESERSRLEEASTIWENIRKLKHDLKNHFTVLKGKLDEEDLQSCKKYLSELNQTVEGMGNLIRSGNTVIDYLINTKLSNLNNVQVLISGYVGKYNDIEEIDLACILGNIIDNAIEAQKSEMTEKRIELHFLEKNANRVIICKNTISTSVLKDNKELKTTKDSSDMHGLGHQIVESTVQKYNGILTYFEEDGMFGVQILLPRSDE